MMSADQPTMRFPQPPAQPVKLLSIGSQRVGFVEPVGDCVVPNVVPRSFVEQPEIAKALASAKAPTLQR